MFTLKEFIDVLDDCVNLTLYASNRVWLGDIRAKSGIINDEVLNAQVQNIAIEDDDLLIRLDMKRKC